MSTHNICFRWEIRRIWAFFRWKKRLICCYAWMQSSFIPTTKTLIRLCRCVGWFEPSLGARRKVRFFTMRLIYDFIQLLNTITCSLYWLSSGILYTVTSVSAMSLLASDKISFSTKNWWYCSCTCLGRWKDGQKTRSYLSIHLSVCLSVHPSININFVTILGLKSFLRFQLLLQSPYLAYIYFVDIH